MTDNTYRFTENQDWFSHNIPSWAPLLKDIKERTSCPRALEIGSWEGRSAVFLLKALCNPEGSIVCIDHFDLLTTAAGRDRFDKIQHNLQVAGNSNFRIMPQFSFPALMSLLTEEIGRAKPGFDWIYIDGSHEADDTLLDGELCWRLARNGAIVIFDDYHWDAQPEDSSHHPRRGVDAFLQLHAGEYTMLSDSDNYQVVLRKTTDMRIGFLVDGDQRGRSLADDFSYGINLALAIDSPFVMPAAVAIQTVVQHTRGRISIYIIDCGLTEDDKETLNRCLPRSSDVTLSFLCLPDDSIASELGPSWAKLDLFHILPIERVLYLDADVLVRHDISPLWQFDLHDRALGAIPDVGHPMGHNSFEKHPYFNAGVLLMNLTKIRETGSRLLERGREMQNAKFRDQDALNEHFKDWVPVSLRWNAQGLGTYASYPSADRKRLKLDEMNDPSIIHFTGPVNPSLAETLNPYVQPPVAKPWGYLGSPGHPFYQEWWEALAKTPYAGYAASELRIKRNEEAVEKRINEAAEEFRSKVSETRVHLAQWYQVAAPRKSSTGGSPSIDKPCFIKLITGTQSDKFPTLDLLLNTITPEPASNRVSYRLMGSSTILCPRCGPQFLTDSNSLSNEVSTIMATIDVRIYRLQQIPIRELPSPYRRPSINSTPMGLGIRRILRSGVNQPNLYTEELSLLHDLVFVNYAARMTHLVLICSLIEWFSNVPYEFTAWINIDIGQSLAGNFVPVSKVPLDSHCIHHRASCCGCGNVRENNDYLLA
ncbi:hypothetical protein NP233_g9727 [Leucocoprinus birnbaumii]|uniref:Glycosyltransferase family 8 protein n=1 Tax=Leucocoprinus birnbaumii TaxID=56174 RepID=A0AAD5VLM3_9AGAR|nr:hypothetical protein NP233_g9727 [Leucocoprinus birnbaumii]